MTISTTDSRVEYTGDGTTTEFAVPFYFLANGDLYVYQAGTLKTITTHYTVAGAGDEAGGTVTFLTAPTNGQAVVIIRDPAITQGTDYLANDPFPASSHERALDRLTMICQRNRDLLNRAMVLPDTDTSGADTTLPTPTANKALIWNSTGDALINSTDDYDDQLANVTAQATAAAASAAAAAASEAAAGASEATASTAATNAGNSASAASTSATNASSSASTASTAATNASNSASAAATSETNAAASALAAAASETAAAASETAAALSETNAAASEAAAAASQTAAAASAGNASTSETNAAASAAAAAATLASALWRGVERKTANYTITQADNGKLFVCDTTGGQVTITLPQIATLTLPFTVGVQLDAGGNSVVVARSGTDTIDGDTSQTIAVSGSGKQLIADATPAPDEWEAMDFGRAGGNLTDEVFTAGVGFTAGSSTSVTLSQDYGSETNIWVFFDGVQQGSDTYSLSGTTLTFTSAIPGGVSKVYVKGGTTLSIGTPSDGTVTTAKIADLNVTAAKLATDAVETAKIKNANVTPAKLAGGTIPAATGYSATSYNAGTKSSGTYTPDPANGNFQYAVNGGAHTLAPPATDTSMVIQYTNNASAGAITTSGFTKVTPSASPFTTTNGDDFLCYVTKIGTFSHLHVQALQ